MKHILLLAITASLTPIAIWAQFPNSAFEFRTVAQPGTLIAGYTLTPNTTVHATALNDSGELVFIARSIDQGAVLTSHRLVAKKGDTVGGKYLMQISASCVAINNAGNVAFGAWYGDNANAGDPSGFGIFVDNRLALTPSLPDSGVLPVFTLSDEGQVVIQNASTPANAPTPKKSSNPFGGLHIKTPNLPVTFGSEKPKQQETAAPVTRPSAPTFPTNHHGQILVPVNFKEGGFLLLLGTPVLK